MTRIIYSHPAKTRYDYHIYTDLDFWDAFRILKGLAEVRRNFGQEPPGNEFPTQILGIDLDTAARRRIERRLSKAIVSPPRHIIVQSMVQDGRFEFDPARYYPKRWRKSQMMHFTLRRLPLEQAPLSTPHKTVRLSWVDGKIRIEQVQRETKYDPIIGTRQEARRRRFVPSCF